MHPLSGAQAGRSTRLCRIRPISPTCPLVRPRPACHAAWVLVYAIVAGVLCAGVVIALVVTSLRALTTDRLEHDRDRQAVNDCLANAERVIDLTDRAMRRQADGLADRQPSVGA